MLVHARHGYFRSAAGRDIGRDSPRSYLANIWIETRAWPFLHGASASALSLSGAISLRNLARASRKDKTVLNKMSLLLCCLGLLGASAMADAAVARQPASTVFLSSGPDSYAYGPGSRYRASRRVFFISDADYQRPTYRCVGLMEIKFARGRMHRSMGTVCRPD